jgi:hypothetical protein
MEASTSQARARWELENDVAMENDDLLRFDQASQSAIQQEAAWKSDPRHFEKYVSLVALGPSCPW